jgi:hypothetical protein
MDIMHGLRIQDESNASPGLFFAVIEIKLMLTFTLLRFDIRTKDGKCPKDIKIASILIPNVKAEILFKRRCISWARSNNRGLLVFLFGRVNKVLG